MTIPGTNKTELNKIKFGDSYALLTGSLASLCKSFKVKYQKKGDVKHFKIYQETFEEDDITYNITINVALSGNTLMPREIGRDDIRTIFLLFNNDSTDPPKLLFRIFDDFNILFLDSLPIITMSYEQHGRIVRETSRVEWSDCFNILNTQDGYIPLIKGRSLEWIEHRNYVHSIRFDNSGIKFQIKWWAKEFKLYTFTFRFNL